MRTDAGPLICVQLVAAGTGAQGPSTGVAAAMGAAAVVGLTAVHDFHLNPCGETSHPGCGMAARMTPTYLSSPPTSTQQPASGLGTPVGSSNMELPGLVGSGTPCSPSTLCSPRAHTQGCP